MWIKKLVMVAALSLIPTIAAADYGDYRSCVRDCNEQKDECWDSCVDKYAEHSWSCDQSQQCVACTQACTGKVMRCEKQCEKLK